MPEQRAASLASLSQLPGCGRDRGRAGDADLPPRRQARKPPPHRLGSLHLSDGHPRDPSLLLQLLDDAGPAAEAVRPRRRLHLQIAEERPERGLRCRQHRWPSAVLAKLGPQDVGAKPPPHPVPGGLRRLDGAVGERPAPGSRLLLQPRASPAGADQMADLVQGDEVATWPRTGGTRIAFWRRSPRPCISARPREPFSRTMP